MKIKLLSHLLFWVFSLNCLNATPVILEENETIETLLQKQVDEERMAYNLYTKLFKLHPEIKSFKNMIVVKKRHFSMLLDYAKSNYPNLETGHLNSRILLREVQMRYDKLLKEGKTSGKSALEVGIKLEKMAIEEIEHFLSLEPGPELTTILVELKQGSQKHLSAFRRQKTR